MIKESIIEKTQTKMPQGKSFLNFVTNCNLYSDSFIRHQDADKISPQIIFSKHDIKMNHTTDKLPLDLKLDELIDYSFMVAVFLDEITNEINIQKNKLSIT